MSPSGIWFCCRTPSICEQALQPASVNTTGLWPVALSAQMKNGIEVDSDGAIVRVGVHEVGHV